MNPFLIQQEKAELKSAFELQMRAELVSVCLKDCRASGPSSDCDLELGIRLAMQHTTSRVPAPSNQLRLDIGLHFEATETGEAAGRLFEIDCHLELTYVLDDGFSPTDEQVNAFKGGSAVFNCWPYAREFVQNLTARMGLQVPPLPLLRVLPKVVMRRQPPALEIDSSVRA